MSSSTKPPVDQRVANSRQETQETEAEQHDEDEGGISQRFLLFQVMPSWLTSFIFHIILIIVLALIWFVPQQKEIVDLFSGEATQQTNSTVDVDFDSIEVATDELQMEIDEQVTESNFENQVDTELQDQLENTLLDLPQQQLPVEIGCRIDRGPVQHEDRCGQSFQVDAT